MKNYPLFTAPDTVWTDIKKRTGHNKKSGILSRAALLKKVYFAVGTFALLFVAIGFLYTKTGFHHTSGTSTYFQYINTIDTLTNSMDNSLNTTLIQINQL